METLKVSSTSDPGATAGAVANAIRERGEAQMQVIGPRAANQAVKAIAIARGYVAAAAMDLYFTPSFTSVYIDDQERTALHFSVRTRHPIPRVAEAAPEGAGEL